LVVAEVVEAGERARLVLCALVAEVVAVVLIQEPFLMHHFWVQTKPLQLEAVEVVEPLQPQTPQMVV